MKKDRLTVTATEEGLERAKNALMRLFDSKTSFANCSIVSRGTINKFFSLKPIQLDNFKKICEELTLDWQEIADIEEKKQSSISSERVNIDIDQEVEQDSKSGSRQVTVTEEKTGKIRAAITLEGDIDSVSNQNILLTILREYAGNTIVIKDILVGSIKLIVEGSPEDIERLVSLIDSGELKEVDGLPIEAIQVLGNSSEDKETSDANLNTIGVAIPSDLTRQSKESETLKNRVSLIDSEDKKIIIPPSQTLLKKRKLTMTQRVVVRLKGSLSTGYTVRLEIGEENYPQSLEEEATLPPNAQLAERTKEWRQQYLELIRQRDYQAADLSREPFRIDPISVTYEGSFGERQEQFRQLSQRLQKEFNDWLCSPSFYPVNSQILYHLQPNQSARVVILTSDLLSRYLPWNRWSVLTYYAQVEIGIGGDPLKQLNGHPSASKRQSVHILAILGDARGINVEADRQELEALPNATIKFLVEPQPQELSDELWHQHWDILFFAGHGCTEGQTGRLAINQQDSLSLEDLKQSLNQAVAKGLQLAIFNSCDGLGLTESLQEVHIPHMIVMREPVADRVAQEFLRYFLQAFSEGKPLYWAVRQAREQLEGLQVRFPYATWLPTICQNSLLEPPTWQRLLNQDGASTSITNRLERRQNKRNQNSTLVFVDLVNSTGMKAEISGKDISERNQIYENEILLPHCERIAKLLKDYSGRIVGKAGDEHLLIFNDESDAIQWAVSLQQNHQQQPIKTPVGSLQLRIGIHTGRPKLMRDGDLVGRDVDYAARIESLSNADQILLSEETTVLLRILQLEGVSFHRHGVFELKGIGAVPVYELLYDGKDPQAVRGTPLKPGETQTENIINLREASQTPIQLSTTCLVSTGISLVVMGIRLLGGLVPAELAAYDLLMRQRPSELIDRRILVVEITTEDIRRYGYPLEDKVLAKMIKKLAQHQPYAIGVDLHRFQAQGEGRQEFIDQFTQNPNLMIVCSYGSDDLNYATPPPEFSQKQRRNQMGFSDFPVDEGDNSRPSNALNLGSETFMEQFLTVLQTKVRRYELSYHPNLSDSPNKCQTPYSLSLQLAFRFLKQSEVQPLQVNERDRWQFGEVVFQPLTKRFGGYQNLNGQSNQIMINYRVGPPGQRVNLQGILEDEVNISLIKDRLVLVGVTAPAGQDFLNTPYGVQGGVWIHAHIISQILSAVQDERPLISALPQWGDFLLIWIYTLMGGLVISRLKILFAIVFTGVAMIVLYGICLGALIKGMWLALIPSALSLVMVMVCLQVLKKAKLIRIRRKINND